MSPTTPSVSEVNRRRYLRAVCGVMAAGTLVPIAGCSASGGDGQLTVIVTNENEGSHTVGGRLTDGTGTVIEEFSAEEVRPGVSTRYSADGLGGDAYVVTVEERDGDSTLWKQTTRWSQLDACPSLTYTVRITRDLNGIPTVIADEECESL